MTIRGTSAFAFLALFSLFAAPGRLLAGAGENPCPPALKKLEAAAIPHSQLFPGETSDQYPRWLADQVNRVVSDLSSASDPLGLEEGVARSRGDLQLALRGSRKDSGGQEYGKRRTAEEWVFSYVGRTGEYQRAKMNTPLRAEMVQLARQGGFPYRSFDPGIGSKVQARDVEYLLLDGTRIVASKVFLYPGDEIGVMSPPVSVVKVILHDVWQRLALARAAGSPLARAEALSDAIEGYFKAMPYQRGTASIGTAFWSGVGSRLFDRPLILPDGIDVRAMVGDHETFRAWLVPVFLGAGSAD